MTLLLFPTFGFILIEQIDAHALRNAPQNLILISGLNQLIQLRKPLSMAFSSACSVRVRSTLAFCSLAKSCVLSVSRLFCAHIAFHRMSFMTICVSTFWLM